MGEVHSAQPPCFMVLKPVCREARLGDLPCMLHCFLSLQVRSQLAAAQEELRQAQVAIQERDFAIATQQQCEAALAGHAGALNEALAGALADVALLFQRWEEKNALEDANAALVQVSLLTGRERVN